MASDESEEDEDLTEEEFQKLVSDAKETMASSRRRALIALASFLAVCFAWSLFLEGHIFNRYYRTIGNALFFTDLVLLLWVILSTMDWWSTWRIFVHMKNATGEPTSIG